MRPISEMDLDARKVIWIALSDLYLDTALQDYDYKDIAKTILESPFTLEEVKSIDRYEVYPVLKNNFLSVAGVWTGFQEDWLVKEISKKIQERKFYTRRFIDISYYLFARMHSRDWERIEDHYEILRQKNGS